MSVDVVTFSCDGTSHQGRTGTSVAAALLNAGIATFRTSAAGHARAPLCGMGVCYECRVTVNGIAHIRSCMIDIEDGMEISTHEAR